MTEYLTITFVDSGSLQLLNNNALFGKVTTNDIIICLILAAKDFTEPKVS